MTNKDSEVQRLIDSAVPITAPSPVELHDRLTGVITINHEHFGDPPFVCQPCMGKIHKYKEEPYSRRVTVGTVKKPLDTGWIEHPGLLVISNRAGLDLMVNPTEDEKLKYEKMVAYLGNSHLKFPIRPGMSFISEILPDQELFLWSLQEGLELRLSLLSE